jgi:RNA-binding protein Musashi
MPANAAAAAAQLQAAANTNQQQAAGHTQQAQVQQSALTPVATTNPYQGYSLANIDMSSFQGVDWSSMYGMYV